MRTWQRERSTCGRKLCPPGVLQTAEIPPKFSTLSRSMSIPPHLVTFPHLHSRPPPTIVGNFIGNNSKGKRLVVGYKPYYRELSHFLQPPSLQSPLAIFFLWLSGAISPHLAAQAPPCLSPVYNCLQTEIVLTPPVTFKALPSAHTTTLCQEKTFWLENT